MGKLIILLHFSNFIMDQTQPVGGSNLKDAIVTLPTWGIALIAALCASSLVLASWLAITAPSEGIKATAVQLLIFMVPLLSAVIASIAIRRTSTGQIDRLITGFLEKTVLQRFQTWCAPSESVFFDKPYPFSSVNLKESTKGLSYAYFAFQWRDSGHEPAIVGVKTNIFNFEIFTQLKICLPPTQAASFPHESLVITPQHLEEIRSHPILGHFMGLIQGSVNEGYEIKIKIEFSSAPNNGEPSLIIMHISLRQKVRENFLTSPFLKRYFSEDAAIAVGVLFSEYRKSDFMPPGSNSRGVV